MPAKAGQGGLKLMRKTFVLAAALLILSISGILRPVCADTIQNDSVLINLFVYVQCANGGAGEYVTLSGSLHVSYFITIDKSGGLHVNMHFQAQGISGYGLTTG